MSKMTVGKWVLQKSTRFRQPALPTVPYSRQEESSNKKLWGGGTYKWKVKEVELEPDFLVREGWNRWVLHGSQKQSYVGHKRKITKEGRDLNQI